MTADPSTLDHRLAAIGDALQEAVAADLRQAGRRPAAATAAGRRRWRPRRRAALLGIAALIVIPSAALATGKLLLWSDSQVAASLPQGTLALGGTDPTCTTVVANVEYHCTLAKAPAAAGASTAAGAGARPGPARLRALAKHGFHVVRVENGFAIARRGGRNFYVLVPTAHSRSAVAGSTNWRGTVEPSVDSTRHVNGGCRALNSAGTDWECYIGQAAVAQSIISRGFLGQYAPAPGVG